MSQLDSPLTNPPNPMRRLPVILSIVVAASAVIGAAAGGLVLRQRAQRQEADRLLAEARAEVQKGNAEEGMQLLARYMGQRRDDDLARREYVDLLLQKIAAGEVTGKQAAWAFKFLEEVVRDDPDDHWLRYQLAAFQVRIREFTSALEHLRFLREAVGPDETLAATEEHASKAGATVGRLDIDTLFADALVKTGRFDEAVNVLSALVGFDPASRQFAPLGSADGSNPPPPPPAVFQQLATLLETELHDDDAAGRVIVRNSVVNDDDAAAWIALASWKWFHDKDLDAAMAAVRAATEIAPDDPQVMNANFQIALSGGRIDTATAIARRGVELHPDKEWPHVALAKLALQQGDAAGTIEILVSGLKNLRRRPALLQVLVDVPDKPAWNAPLEAAVAELRGEYAADDPFRCVLEGRTLMAKGRWLEAVRSLQRGRALAGKEEPLKLTADLALAKCHEALGDSDLQLAAAQRALVANQQSVEARVAAARALLACGRLDLALQEFRRVASRLPGDELAARPEVWAPLMRLEYAALSGRRLQRRDPSAIDARHSALAAAVAENVKPLLESERLAAEGKIEEAIAVLDDASSAAPDDPARVAAALALRARVGKAEQVTSFIDGLSAQMREQTDVVNAIQDACLMVPPAVGEKLAAELLAQRPDDLRAAMRLFSIKYRRGHDAELAPLAQTITAVAGADSTHAAYTEAASWVASRRDQSDRRSGPTATEIARIRERVAELEVARPEWTEVQCLIADLDLLEGKTKEAVARLGQALKTRPSDPEVARPLVTLLTRLQRFSEAEQALEGLDAAALDRLGLVVAELRLRSGKTEEAGAMAERQANVADDPDDLLGLADLLARCGRASAATAALRRAAALTPTRVDVWLALADHEAKFGNDQAAGEALDQASQRVAESWRPLLRAEIDRRAGNRGAAARGFRSLLEDSAADVMVKRRAADFFLETDLSAEARTTLNDLLSIRTDTPAAGEASRWARRRLAELDIRNGSFTVARKAVQSLSETVGGVSTYAPEDADLAARLLAARDEPASWRLAFDLLDGLRTQQRLTADQRVLSARLRARLGDWRRARDELQALSLQADAPDAVHAALAELSLAYDGPAAAAGALRELTARAPTAAETLTLQAKFAAAVGDRPAAVAAAKGLMPAGDVSEANVRTVLANATTLEQLGFSAAADNLLERAAPVSTEATLQRLAFLLRQNRLDDADALLESSRDALPESPEFVLLEAKRLEARQEPKEAEALYRRLIDDADTPANARVSATARLVSCLLERGESGEAFSLANRAVGNLGPHPDLLDARGCARLATGNTSGAIEDFSNAALAPTPLRVLHLASAKGSAEAWDEARAILLYAARLGLDPQSLGPLDRQRLEVLEKRFGPKPR